jgi:hypothetical protein
LLTSWPCWSLRCRHKNYLPGLRSLCACSTGELKSDESMSTEGSLAKITSARVYSLLRGQTRAWAEARGFCRGTDQLSWIRPYRQIYIRVWAGVNRYGWLDGIGGEFRVQVETGLDGRIDGGTSLLEAMIGPLLDDKQRRVLWDHSRSIVARMPPSAKGVLFGYPEDGAQRTNSEIWMVYRTEADIERWCQLVLPLIDAHVDLVAPGWSDEPPRAVPPEAFADRFPRVRSLSGTLDQSLKSPFASDTAVKLRAVESGDEGLAMTCRLKDTDSRSVTMLFAGDSAFAISTTGPETGRRYNIFAGRKLVGTVTVERVEWRTSPDDASDMRLRQVRGGLPEEFSKHRMIVRADQAPRAL